MDAADEDRATGGIDVLRGIFPIVNFCSDRGHRARGRRRDRAGLPADPGAPGRAGCQAMSMPFYVSPEQVMQDKAEYARKGIGRGKSSVTLEYAERHRC